MQHLEALFSSKCSHRDNGRQKVKCRKNDESVRRHTGRSPVEIMSGCPGNELRTATAVEGFNEGIGKGERTETTPLGNTNGRRVNSRLWNRDLKSGPCNRRLQP